MDFDKAWKEVSVLSQDRYEPGRGVLSSIPRWWRITGATPGVRLSDALGSHVFFHGLAVGETNKVNIADGKTLVIKYLGLGEVEDEYAYRQL